LARLPYLLTAMKHRIRGINFATNELETLVAEGMIGERPWAVVDCFNYNSGKTSRILRIRCTDIGSLSYAALLVSDWRGLLKEEASIKSPTGVPYYPKFNTTEMKVWEGDCDKAEDFYMETKIDMSSSKDDFAEIAKNFLDAAAPLLMRMALVKPLKIKLEAAP